MDKGKILVVDDDKGFLILIEHLLQKMNYDVATVSDSTAAYQKILEFSPNLIISDMEMPELDGAELLKIIKSSKLTNHIPLIFLSSVTEPDKIQSNLKQGADDFINKPIHPNVLR